MIQITLSKGKYEVRAVDERGRQFIAAFAAARLMVPMRDGGLLVDSRFLTSLTDAAKESEIAVAWK